MGLVAVVSRERVNWGSIMVYRIENRELGSLIPERQKFRRAYPPIDAAGAPRPRTLSSRSSALSRWTMP